MVAASEAHDSGLCARQRCDPCALSRETCDNLTLASPQVNRHEKKREGCRPVAARTEPMLVRRRSVVAVRKKYRLTVDRARSRGARGGAERGCDVTRDGARDVYAPAATTSAPAAQRAAGGLRRCACALYDDNRNGQHHLQGGAPARDCARPPRPSGVRAHARW